jgi:2-dehydropantoate 2-reductase
VFATDRPKDCGEQDAVFVTLKANALQDVRIASLLASQTLVVFGQNGMPWWYPHSLPEERRRPPSIPLFALAERFFPLLRPDQVIGCIVQTSNEIVRPGHVVNNVPRNALMISHIDDHDSTAVQALRKALEEAGLASPAPRDIREAVWLKLLRNMGSSLISAVTQQRAAIVKTDPLLGTLFTRLVEETLRLAHAYGYPLDALANVQKLLDESPDVKPSLLQDYERRRPVEIDELIFAPLLFARAAGVATPTIDAVAAIARRLAADRGLVGERFGHSEEIR